MKKAPFKNGTLVEILKPIAMMRGKPEDDTGDTVLLKGGEIVLITATEFRGKTPYVKWWHICLMHTDVVCWRLMDSTHIAEAFKKVDAIGVATDLQDRMMDEDDWTAFRGENWDDCPEDEYSS